MKQFCHYLVGCRFQLLTDHAPKWSSAQKMEGLLCHWALAIQKYDFHILYRKDSLNSNADTISRCDTQAGHCTVTMHGRCNPRKRTGACKAVARSTKQIYTALKDKVTPCALDWQSSLLWHYKKLWSQFNLMDGIVCGGYSPHPGSDVISVPVLPASLHQNALHCNHDIPTSRKSGNAIYPCSFLHIALWCMHQQECHHLHLRSDNHLRSLTCLSQLHLTLVLIKPQLQAKLVELRDFVESQATHAASKQKCT